MDNSEQGHVFIMQITDITHLWKICSIVKDIGIVGHLVKAHVIP